MGTLSRLIIQLKKNKISTLEAKDLVSSEKKLKKLKSKKLKLMNSLAKSISLKELNLIQYELKTTGKQFIGLAELITAVSSNSSLEFLDVSHNTLTREISVALIEVIRAQCVPLKHLSLSYLLNVECMNLNNIIRALQEKKSLLSLNLYGNELPTSICNELVKLINSEESILNELNLSRCLMLSADLVKVKEACEHKDKKFSLITDQVLLYDSSESSPSTLKEHLSLKVIKALSKPIAPSKRLYSSGSEEVLTSSGSNSMFFATAKEITENISKDSLVISNQEKDKQNHFSFSLSYK